MALASNRVQVLRRFRPGLAPPEEGSGRVWGFLAKPRQWRWQASSGVRRRMGGGSDGWAGGSGNPRCLIGLDWLMGKTTRATFI
jgi:hypothetical protein